MGEDFLSMDSILTEDEAATLFTQEEAAPSNEETEPKETEEPTNTTEVVSENPFEDDDEETPESVGSNEENKEKDIKGKENTPSKEKDVSPENNFYSSIASALKEEGVFPDLEDSEVENVKEPEDFRDLVTKQIQAGLNEVQQRITKAMSYGIEPNEIRQYENTLGYLNSIKEENLTDESDEGEKTRRTLIFQDFINRGYSQERATRMTDKLFDSGDDVEEAKSALESNKEFYSKQYQNLLDAAKKQSEEEDKRIKRQAEELKKDILSSEKVFGDIELDKNTRQKVYDSISKPVWKDPETGQYYTAVQKYKKDNENDFIKNVGLLYTLTNGFKDMDNIIKPRTKKEVKSKLRDLEHVLNNSNRPGGKLSYVGDSSNSSKNPFLNGFTIDLG